MKKKILLIGGVFVLFCFITFLVLLKDSVSGAEIEVSKDKYIAAKSGLNLRSEPGKSSKIVSSIPFGSKVTVEKSDGDEIFLDGRYGKWVNVKYDNKTGWVFGGFLCDFKPDKIIKPAADFYRSKYRDKFCKGAKDCTDEFANELANFPDDYVYVDNIIDNYIHLKIPTSVRNEANLLHPIDVVWRYDVKQNKFFEVYNFGYRDSNSHFFYLDNDKYPDMVVQFSWYDNSGIHIFLGSENGFTKVYKDSCNSYHGYYLTEGSCGNMRFVCSFKSSKDETMYFFRYNCNKKKAEKYAESKITRSDGIITSIDLKNMSVFIKGDDDLKSTPFKFSSKRFSSDEDIKYLKNFKTNDEVSFSYETVGGKQMILDIGWVDVD